MKSVPCELNYRFTAVYVSNVLWNIPTATAPSQHSDKIHWQNCQWRTKKGCLKCHWTVFILILNVFRLSRTLSTHRWEVGRLTTKRPHNVCTTSAHISWVLRTTSTQHWHTISTWHTIGAHNVHTTSVHSRHTNWLLAGTYVLRVH